MTPLPTRDDWASRPDYDPNPGSVSAAEIVALAENDPLDQFKLVHLSDWAVGCLLAGIATGEVTRLRVDIFETVFVRGAKPRKNKKHFGHPFTGPGGEVVVIDGQRYNGGDPSLGNGKIIEFATIRTQLVIMKRYAAWYTQFQQG